LKKSLSLLLLLVFFSACKSTHSSTSGSKESNNTKAFSIQFVKQLIKTASENLGSGYKAGGITPDGFDCSGLIYATFLKFDIKLPRTSAEMSKMGKKLQSDEIQKGDLIFFKTNGKSAINHVGLVIEVNNDEIKFIHASNQKGVVISSTKEPYYGKSFAQANRILM
jgi:cell wall-associated NlpC family hydrolase